MHTIDIRLRELAQLYDSLDPSPFREKALDRDVEASLVDSAGEFPSNAPLRVLVHGPATLAPHTGDIASAIHAHFELSATLAERRHRRRKRVGRLGMLLGFIVLGLALALRSLVEGWRAPAGEIFAEGLLILAWVALWRPAEVALFDQWESREQLLLLRKLAQVPVEFVQADASTGPGSSPRRTPLTA